jgi:hypothetical protein
LSTLHAGQKIQVVEMNSKKHSGTFVNFSDTAISFQDTAGEQTIPKQDLRRVKLMENKHRLRNTLIGAGVGAGAGTVIGAASFQPCSPSQSSVFNLAVEAQSPRSAPLSVPQWAQSSEFCCPATARFTM